MKTIYAHISHLLLRYGYAEVPGVGVFREIRRNARFEGDMLMAPDVTVVFDHTAMADASQLVASLVRADGVDESEAVARVDKECRAIVESLSSGRTVSVPAVGTLKADVASGEPVFSPYPSVSWLPDLTPVAIELRKIDDDKVDEAAAALETRRQSLARSLRRTASSAAAIAVFVLFAFIVSQIPGQRSSKPNMASVGLETIAAVPADESVITAPGAAEPALVLILNTPADASAPAKQRYRHHENEPGAAVGRYCLVVASLASQAEADSYIKAHSTTEIPLSLLAENGRWRIYALSGSSFEEVSAVARNLDIYSTYPSAWICRR